MFAAVTLAAWAPTFPLLGQTATSSTTNTVIGYSTFLGDGGGNPYAGGGGHGIALGPAGTVFVLGHTDSATTFQFTYRLGPAGETRGSFVTKYDPASHTVVYSTFIPWCFGRGIAVDGLGNAYITGQTDQLLTTTNAYQTNYGGGDADAFVAKLSADGSRLVYSTFIGGNNADVGSRIVVDAVGQAIVTGTTASSNFPVTAGVVQGRLAGDWNAFVAKLDASGSALVYSTYLGGNCQELGLGLAVDSVGNVYVSGSSCSTNFTAAPHPIHLGTNASGTNAFVAKLASDAKAVQWLTLFGGDGEQYASAIAVDAGGGAYIFGQTDATNFPITPNALQAHYGGGSWDNFVMKLNGSNVVYSTYLGGSSSEDQDEFPTTAANVGNLHWFAPVAGITVDPSGNVYVAGRTGSRDIARGTLTENLFAVADSDGYVAKINPSGSALLYLRFFGSATYSCTASAVAVDGAGNVFVTGRAGVALSPPYFPVTPGAFQTTFGANTVDNYLVQLRESAPLSTNDNFTNRVLLGGKQITVQANNSAGTKEPDEAPHAGNAGGKSLWWSWTAPATGALDLSTTNSSFNTLLAVYTGDVLKQLQVVASNAASPSVVRFHVVAGTTYQIAVDGMDGASGSVALSLEFSAPPNDDFADRTVITNFPVTVQGSNVDATLEPGDKDQSGYSGRSVWWSWISPVDQPVAITTAGSSFDTVLAVYTGTNLYGLSLVAWNDDEGNGVQTSRVPVQAQAGVTYQIQVSGAWGASGAIQLSVTNPPPPPNDDFANRTPWTFTGTTGQVTGTIWGATAETNEPPLGFACAAGRTVWWTWTAPSTGWVTLDTDGSDFSTLLGVFTGDTLTNLTRIAASARETFPDSYQSLSRVQLGVISNTTYNIVVDGGCGVLGGSTVLNLRLYHQSKILNLPAAWSPAMPFDFQVVGVPYLPYRIQVSTNLIDWNFFPSDNLTGSVFHVDNLTGSPFHVRDTNTLGLRRRFYRVIETP